ncbi:NPCBM/NEW2 domain-containing protein [Sphingomonas sp. LR60]
MTRHCKLPGGRSTPGWACWRDHGWRCATRTAHRGSRHWSASTISTRNTRDPVEFFIYGDGRLLARSGAQRFGAGAKALSADVRDVKVIELITRAPRRSSDLPIVTTWAEAALRGGAAR